MKAEHIQLVMYFNERYSNEYGIEYLAEKKDFSIAHQILKLISFDEAKALIDTMFQCDDNFISNATKTIGFLRYQLNSLRQIRAKNQPRVMEPME